MIFMPWNIFFFILNYFELSVQPAGALFEFLSTILWLMFFFKQQTLSLVEYFKFAMRVFHVVARFHMLFFFFQWQ